MKWKAKWIKPIEDLGDVVPIFLKNFSLSGDVKKATLSITAMGVYEAEINGVRIGKFVLAPGWTFYEKRLQYQTYDVTELIKQENQLTVLVGKGWYRGRIGGCQSPQEKLRKNPAGLLVQMAVTYKDGSQELIITDDSWKCSESAVRLSEIYDGEIYDATYQPDFGMGTVCFDGPMHTLIPQQGEEICEQERISVARIFTTPLGEMVVDFGQEITGYVEIHAEGKKGEVLDLSFAEVMDKDGNFYNENYGHAKAQYHYTCCDGYQAYKPKLTFWGFRYIRVNQFPGGKMQVKPENFTAIVVHSDIKRIGHFSCSDRLLNKLFSNIVWGQKGNFLDVPTDCPQRGERLGWTGDAQVFVRTACYNYDVEKFFVKWLSDLKACQRENGSVGYIVPDLFQKKAVSAAWGDAATICPWQIYLAYGNVQILRDQFDSMKKWVDYITSVTETPYLWTGGTHFGDWLGLDAPSGSYKGSTRDDFVASAFYYYSTELVMKAGKVLNEDVTTYELLCDQIKDAFRKEFSEYYTQTECVLAAYFHLAEDCRAAADQLAELIVKCGGHLQTGFVGTPYLLHVLSEYGYAKMAYSLLLREQYPSWIYPITKGATTMWEHWDGIKEDGSFWSADMNSFNHYAYGSVADWIYSVAAGISPIEEMPGYKEVRIAPIPDSRLDWLRASLEIKQGIISSEWRKENDKWQYEIITPVKAEVVIDGATYHVLPGKYYYYSDIK